PRLVDDADAGDGRGHVSRPIPAGVVDDEHFVRPPELRRKGEEARRDPLLLVVRADNHADARPPAPPAPPHAHPVPAPGRNSVIATSTFSFSACRIAGHSLSHRSSVFHEYRCLALWKSLLATYGKCLRLVTENRSSRSAASHTSTRCESASRWSQR